MSVKNAYLPIVETMTYEVQIDTTQTFDDTNTDITETSYEELFSLETEIQWVMTNYGRSVIARILLEVTTLPSSGTLSLRSTICGKTAETTAIALTGQIKQFIEINENDIDGSESLTCLVEGLNSAGSQESTIGSAEVTYSFGTTETDPDEMATLVYIGLNNIIEDLFGELWADTLKSVEMVSYTGLAYTFDEDSDTVYVGFESDEKLYDYSDTDEVDIDAFISPPYAGNYLGIYGATSDAANPMLIAGLTIKFKVTAINYNNNNPIRQIR